MNFVQKLWLAANLNPEELPQEIVDLPKGVYFGWVQVRATGVDRGVHKMVLNIGQRPTFSDSDAITVVSLNAMYWNTIYLVYDIESKLSTTY